MADAAPTGAAPAPDHVDPPGEAPWAMQLVVRVEKAEPPTERAACAAAARAVVTLLADDRAQPGGEWAPCVDRWLQGLIRKVVRRARAHAWEKAQDIDGVTVAVDGAEVRAIVPGATDAVPLEISRLQVRGLDLDRSDRIEAVDVDEVAPGIVVALAPLDGTSTGKRAAAAGHAAQLAAAAMPDERRQRWADAGHPVTIVEPGPEAWRLLRETAPVVIADAGFTEVDPGTVTALATWA